MSSARKTRWRIWLCLACPLFFLCKVTVDLDGRPIIILTFSNHDQPSLLTTEVERLLAFPPDLSSLLSFLQIKINVSCVSGNIVNFVGWHFLLFVTGWRIIFKMNMNQKRSSLEIWLLFYALSCTTGIIIMVAVSLNKIQKGSNSSFRNIKLVSFVTSVSFCSSCKKF